MDPASTLQVADALIKANKGFDRLVVPGAGHGVVGSHHGKRRLRNFLCGASPAGSCGGNRSAWRRWARMPVTTSEHE